MRRVFCKLNIVAALLISLLYPMNSAAAVPVNEWSNATEQYISKSDAISYLDYFCRAYYSKDWKYSTFIPGSILIGDVWTNDNNSEYEITGTHSFDHRPLLVTYHHTKVQFKAIVTYLGNDKVRVTFTRYAQWAGGLTSEVQTCYQEFSTRNINIK